jgi:hypothetical protein
LIQNHLKVLEMPLYKLRLEDFLLVALRSKLEVHKTWKMLKAKVTSTMLQMGKVNLKLCSCHRKIRHS